MEGCSVDGVNINNLRYAYDTVLMAESEQKLQDMIDMTVTASQDIGLDLNRKRQNA